MIKDIVIVINLDGLFLPPAHVAGGYRTRHAERPSIEALRQFVCSKVPEIDNMLQACGGHRDPEDSINTMGIIHAKVDVVRVHKLQQLKCVKSVLCANMPTESP